MTQDLIDWLRLVLIPEIGSRRGKRLLEKFKTPGAILKAPLETIAEVENIGLVTAGKIVEGRKRIDLERHLKLIEKNNAALIPLDSESYPVSLKSIFDPPLVLFVKGEILPQDYFSVAIVGTRMSSFYGRSMSEKLSRQLAEKGFTIVSGGARGIDTASHQAALRAKGRTLAVLGCGLDVTYPEENEKLFEEIAEHGALISEFPLSTRPDKVNFPMRNRIISGLSLGVVVIEAPQKSGALITVTHANDQGREVFSVPGKADSFVSKGTNQLLREGAKLVENADDIIEELEPLLKSKIKELKTDINVLNNLSLRGTATLSAAKGKQDQSNLKNVIASPSARNDISEEESKLYNLLSSGPLDLDDIIVRSQLPVNVASSALTNLEFKKLIRQSPGKIFAKAQDTS